MLVRMNVGFLRVLSFAVEDSGSATVLTHLNRKSCRSRRILCLLPRQRQHTRWTMVVPFQCARSKSWEFRDVLAKLTSTSCSALRGKWRRLCPKTSPTLELLCRRVQLIIRAHAYDAQHWQ